MNESEFGIVPAENDENLELHRKEERAIERVLRGLAEERDRASSYFEMVPEEYREAVEGLARSNHHHFKRDYPEFKDFLEKMAQNWLSKSRAFGALAEVHGFTSVKSSDRGREDPSDFSWAGLTRSASYLLIGPGAFDGRGRGTTIRYTKIPLRAEGPPSQEVQDGGHVSGALRVGERASALGVSTSPLVSLYRREAPEGAIDASAASRLEDLDASMSHSFIDIDARTLHGKLDK